MEPTISCGDCFNCKDGARNICPKLGFVGLSGLSGGLSEYACVPEQMCHVLPDNVSRKYTRPWVRLNADRIYTVEAGAMVEPLAVAYVSFKMTLARLVDLE